MWVLYFFIVAIIVGGAMWYIDNMNDDGGYDVRS